MQHLNVSGISLELGDRAAELLFAYAAVVAGAGAGDGVRLNDLNRHGSAIMVRVLLNAGTQLVIQPVLDDDDEEPVNTEVESYLTERLAFYGLTSV